MGLHQWKEGGSHQLIQCFDDQATRTKMVVVKVLQFTQNKFCAAQREWQVKLRLPLKSGVFSPC